MLPVHVQTCAVTFATELYEHAGLCHISMQWSHSCMYKLVKTLLLSYSSKLLKLMLESPAAHDVASVQVAAAWHPSFYQE